VADEMTKVGDPGEKPDAGKVKKKISLVKILVLVLIIVLVVIGGALGVLYFLSGLKSADTGSSPKTQASGPGETGSAAQTSAPSQELNTYELKPFIVNLADDGSYLKITVALGYGGVEQQKLLESKSTQMRDTILSILSSNSNKTLATKHGKIKLKEDIKNALDNIAGLKNVITAVYFTDFQIL